MTNSSIMTAKAIRLQALCKKQMPRRDHLSVTFSSGWLTKCKCCWAPNLFTCQGVFGGADSQAVSEALPFLHNRTFAYVRKDVYDADGCGLVFNLAPDQRVALKRPQGCKKANERVAVTVCYN